MADLQIPDEYKPGLLKFLALPEETIEQIIEALQELKPTIYTDKLGAGVAAAVETVSSEDANTMLEGLVGVSVGRLLLGISAAQFAEDISKSQEIDIPSAERESAERHLSRIFGLDNIMVTAKAA